VVISSEMTELIGLCHRILVMRDGRLVGEVSGDGVTEQNLVVLATGAGASVQPAAIPAQPATRH